MFLYCCAAIKNNAKSLVICKKCLTSLYNLDIMIKN